MKKCISLFLISALLYATLSFTACHRADDNGDDIKILCTIFPIYDWVKNVVGDVEGVQVSLLTENGTDLHSFQPSFGDMAKIKDSDVVIFVGGDSDEWVADSIDEDSVAVELCALDSVALYEVSADSIAHAHTHDQEECHQAHDHTQGFDEHMWLSVKNAQAVCREILSLLCEMDCENAQEYTKNTERYVSELDSLDTRMSSLSEKTATTLIFADRFPFVYLFSDYGIDFFAAFEGCSTDTDADIETVMSLSKKMDELSATHIFVTEAPIDGLADSIIRQTKSRAATVITLNSMQSLGKSDIERGVTYASIMSANVSALEQLFE